MFYLRSFITLVAVSVIHLVRSGKLSELDAFGVERVNWSDYKIISEGGLGKIAAHRDPSQRHEVFKAFSMKQAVFDHFSDARHNYAQRLEQVKQLVSAEIRANEAISEFTTANKNFAQYFPHYRGHAELTSNLWVLVFERLDSTLGSLMREGDLSQKSLGERMRAYLEILRAVHVLHSIGLVHCSVHPDNIMMKSDLTKSPPQTSFKLIDFGSSRAGQICSPGVPYFSDGLLHFNLRKIFGVGPGGVRDFAFADIHSAAATIVDVESQAIAKLRSPTLALHLKVMRLFARRTKDAHLAASYHDFIDLLEDMMGLHSSAPGLEAIMQRLESLMLRVSAGEVPDYKPTAVWLKELNLALNKQQDENFFQANSSEASAKPSQGNPLSSMSSGLSQRPEEMLESLDSTTNQSLPTLLTNFVISNYFDFGSQMHQKLENLEGKPAISIVQTERLLV